MFMRLRLLSALFLFILITGCKKEVDTKSIIYNKFIPMNFKQVVPVAGVPLPAPSEAIGNMDFFYNATTRQITYTIRWRILSGNPTSITISGPAAAGFNGNTLQAVTGFPAAISGTVSGSLLIDNQVIREADLLEGLYYVTIRNAAYPLGEIRGQVIMK